MATKQSSSYRDITIALNSKVNLVSLLENHGVVLKKRGNLYEARCPFHSEKTPSFKVYPHTQHYHCYGCGEHGYASHFLKKRQNMSGVETIQYLAELTHTPLEESTVAKLRYDVAQVEKTSEILSLATDFYAKNLRDPDRCKQANEQAMDYLLETRQFKWDVCLEHKIGLSASNCSLVKFLREQHSEYTSDDLIKAGVAKEGKNGHVADHFRGNRIIFPIYDAAKRVVMLSGRSIDDKEKPKYLHTPHPKSETLYGINVLPKGFKKLIVVEGNFDVLRGIESGLPVVGALGGIGSEWQVQRLLELSDYGEKLIYLCADTDDAGIKATIRTIKLFFKNLEYGGLVKVVQLPSDSKKVDLDSFLLSHDIGEFNSILDRSIDMSEFFKQEFLKKHFVKDFATQSPEIQTTLTAKLRNELKEVTAGEFKSNLINFCLDKPQNQAGALSRVANSLVCGSEPKVDMVFWREWIKSGKPILSIDELELLNFFQQNGFGRYWLKDSTGQDIQSVFVRVNNQIVSEVSVEQMRDFVYDYTLGLNNSITKSFKKDNLQRLLVRQVGTHLSELRLKFLRSLNITFHKDTEKSVFFYYKNCFVEVTADSIMTHDYSKLQGVIWKRQILNRNFNKLSDAEIQNGIFTQFQRNICRTRDTEFDEEGDHGKRLKSLQCAIGYLLHRFRTGTRIPAVIFNDERIASEPKGRSGKGLTCKGISHMRPTVEVDGKKFDPSYQHNFQNVRRDTNIIQFDDLDKKFDMESLFSILSNGITINIKGESNPIVIPFDESPKIMMTTNYVISGDSDSHAGRKWEVVASPYYDVDFTPEVEFKLRLFEQFDTTEWSRFDNYMMLCVKKYLRHGVYKHISENLEIRKLIQATNADFIDFANDLERNTEHDKAEILKQFKEIYPDYERVQQRTFTSWLHKYALYTQGIRLDERKSGCNYLFTFVKLG